MSELCPNPDCLAELQGPEIPQAYRDLGYYGDSTHFSRKLGHEISGVFDGVLFWSCPDCGHRWHRFEPGDRRHAAAVEYVGGAS